MKKVLGISLAFAVAFAASASGKPVDQSVTSRRAEIPNLSGETQPSGTTSLSTHVFTDTVSYGGTRWAADSLRWEAIRDSHWSFDTGVGSAFGPTGLALLATGLNIAVRATRAFNAPAMKVPIQIRRLRVVIGKWISSEKFETGRRAHTATIQRGRCVLRGRLGLPGVRSL